MTKRKPVMHEEKQDDLDIAAMVAAYHIEQVPEELEAFVTAVQAAGIRTVLEIGTGHHAGLARFMTERLGLDVTSIDVEKPGTPNAGGRLILVNLGAVATLDERFDLVFIDAVHAYEYVEVDYRVYGALADKMIAMHDVDSPHASCEGSTRFWREIAYEDGVLKPGYFEAVGTEQRAGIGWIVL